MGIRIQPREIVISDDPDGDPFENDLLERKDKAEVLTSLVSNIDGPCTMAVDAAWGAGKTTFLKMGAQYLRNEGFPVVEFNAWETDASGDPFVALTTEITEQLKAWPDSTVASRLHQTQFLAKSLLRKVAPGAIRAASGLLPGVGAELGHVLSSYASEAMAGYFDQKQSAAQFKASLQELANSLRASSENKPTIVLVDELDRCRPTYAIELLETAKHIFGVDNVVFVLAVNREELAHSVRVLYGERFDAEGYLRRFFDIDFRLPAPNREAFIRNMIASIGVEEFLVNSNDGFAQSDCELVIESLVSFLSHSNLSLRSVGQAIHRFGAVLSSLETKKSLYVRTLTVLSILSAVDASLYRRWVEGEINSDQTIESLFVQSNISELRRTMPGALLEAVIISAGISRNTFHLPAQEQESEFPLFSRYLQLSNDSELSRSAEPLDRHWANMIHEFVRSFHGYHLTKNQPLGFAESVQRFELLSQD